MKLNPPSFVSNSDVKMQQRERERPTSYPGLSINNPGAGGEDVLHFDWLIEKHMQSRKYSKAAR